MYAYNLQYSQICIYVYSRSFSLVSVSLTHFSLYPAGIPSLFSIVEASACAFLPPSLHLRSWTSFSAASFPYSALLVVCANSQACTAFTNSLPCLCSIRLRSSCKQASSVVRSGLCVRRTGASCAFPQLPCRWLVEHFKVARKPVGFKP